MLKVLIVDDDVNVGECLNLLLPWDEIGCRCIGFAKNGREAYQIAVEKSPDVIICDIVMPVMGGVELCQKLSEVTTGVAFIFLSAYADFGAAQKALKYHAADYILKPLDADRLDEITASLKRIAQSHTQEDFWTRFLHDGTIALAISAAIKRNDRDYFDELFGRMTSEAAEMSLSSSRVRDVCLFLARLFFEACGQQKSKAEKAAVVAKLQALKFKMDIIFEMSELYMNYLRDNGAAGTFRTSLSRLVKDYIDAHYTEPTLKTATIAAQFNYSVDYVSRIFQSAYKQTISDYIVAQRMAEAERLLAETEAPLDEVAAQAGFDSAAYFCRVFKRRESMTPTQYRHKNLRGG